ncbi:hypothetical protein [Microbacterium sp.]|uniref:hypothetical protein n=1 Tax=Microbacterium sp. TaxID=51671 RepID=UPI0025EA3B27|nr:hypothetical protein [Microbacterium sp.]MBT9605218.1 hypothetical protein [Microbacterium sp.]
MALSLALLGLSVAVVAGVLFVAMPHVGAPGVFTLFLRYAAASGVAAVGASALYLVYGSGGGRPSLAVGDMCMVLVPLLLFVAVRTLDGGRVLWPSVCAFVVAVAVAGVTTIVPLPASLAVKVAVLAIACGACAWSALQSSARPRRAMRTIAVATTGYAVFSVLRLVVAGVTGWGSPPYAAAFSFVPATIVGALVVLGIGIAVAQLRGAVVRVPAPRPDRPAGAIVVVGDWRLASAAYGADRVRGLESDLRHAARVIDPDAVNVPRGVEVAVPHAVATLTERLRTAHGWSADELALLTDGASTGAVRTHPVRTRGRVRGWRPRS